jgi:anion-transporting  ArsA/GET3 family ATPase
MVHQRLVIVGGKGGVGRTTVAAALGLALARAGRRTLLAHVRCRQQLSTLFGLEDPIDDTIRQVEDNLWAVNMNPQAAIREMGLLVLRFRSIYRLVLENRIVRSFLRAVPALEEYSMIGKAWYHTTELLPSGFPRYDTVVFDGPATGHLISMLRIPQVILDAVPEGPLTGDARKARALLSDPDRTCLWLVTLAEEMAASEALDLYRAAYRELDISVSRLVVNRLYPADLGLAPLPHGSADSSSESPGRQLHDTLGSLEGRSMSSELRSLVEAARMFQARRQINDRYLRQLAQQLPLPRVELPHLFVPETGRAQVERLSALLSDTKRAESIR